MSTQTHMGVFEGGMSLYKKGWKLLTKLGAFMLIFSGAFTVFGALIGVLAVMVFGPMLNEQLVKALDLDAIGIADKIGALGPWAVGILALVFIAVAIAVGIWIQLALIRAIDDTAKKDGHRSFRRSFGDAKKHIGAGIGALFFVVLFWLVMAAIAIGAFVGFSILNVQWAGVIAALMIFPLIIWFMVITAFILYEVTLKDMKPIASIKSSIALIKGKWWSTFFELILIGIAMSVLSFIATTALSLIFKLALLPFGEGGLVAANILGQYLPVIVITPLAACMYYVLYRKLQGDSHKVYHGGAVAAPKESNKVKAEDLVP